MESEIVLLDFDGVIADTFQLTYHMHKILRPELTVETYRRLFDHPAQVMPVLESPAEISNYNKAYEVKILSQAFFPDALEVIRLLSGIFTVNCYSTSPRPAVENFLSYYSLSRYCDTLVTGDSPQQVMAAITRYLQQKKLEVSDAVILTDTLGDIRAAHSSSLHALAATWGYQGKDTLSLGTPVALLEDMDSLPGALEEHYDFSSEYQFS